MVLTLLFRCWFVAYLLGNEAILDDLLNALLLGTVAWSILNKAVSMALIEKLHLHL
jgi:hypothetical protein